MKTLIYLLLPLLLVSCTNNIEQEMPNNTKIATFAGGCFWCTEAAFEALDGVVEVVSGYAGGTIENPTYKQVSTGTTGHKEAIQIYYNPEVISYQELVDFFWRQIDPTDRGGQFTDRGPQYQTAIFYTNEEERKIAEDSKKKLQQEFTDSIATEILPFKNFYRAEEEHQDFYKKRTLQYNAYVQGSGRKDTLKEIWEK